MASKTTVKSTTPNLGTMVVYVDRHGVAKPAMITATIDTMAEESTSGSRTVPAVEPGHVHLTYFSPTGAVDARFNVALGPDGAYRRPEPPESSEDTPAPDAEAKGAEPAAV
jgi:hypothetical protein